MRFMIIVKATKETEAGILPEEWAKRFPSPMGDKDGEIEIRQLYDLDDFGPSEAVERFREIVSKV